MITKIFLYFEKKAIFEEELELGNISDLSIAFIEETGEIWTHGGYYTEYEKIKRVLFGTGPGSISDTMKNLRASILGSTVSEDYNTLSKIEKFLKSNSNKINTGKGIKEDIEEDGSTTLSISVDEESIGFNDNNELYLKTCDGGLY